MAEGVTSGSVRLVYRDEGEGEPVVLLHGWPDTGAMWEPVGARLLEHGWRTVRPDLRGCGASDKPTEVADYAMAHLVADVTGLLDDLGLERAHLVGHDWGAALAWAVALLAPSRVSSLTAVSVGHPVAFAGAGVEQMARSWYTYLFAQPELGEALLRWRDHEVIRQWMRHPEAERIVVELERTGQLSTHLNWYRANLSAWSFLAEPLELPAVGVPVLGVWSSKDPALCERQMTDSARHCSAGFTYRRLEGVGHWVPLEAPEELAALVDEHLRSL